MGNGFLKEYFSFSVRERNGIVVLSLILLSIVVGRFIISGRENKTTYDFQSYEDEIDRFYSLHFKEEVIPELFYFDPNIASREDFIKLGLSQKAIKSICNYRDKGGKFYKAEDFRKIYNLTNEEYDNLKDYIVINTNKKDRHTFTEKKTKSKKENEMFIFDPNTTSKEDLEKLGFKDRQIQNLLKFREKGGVFRSPEDLSKIYGIDNKTFEALEPYILIPPPDNTGNVSIAAEVLQVNLNKATIEELQALRGIGPAYSKRITEYRGKLGGFVSHEQLMEVYGFTDELMNSIKDHLIIDTNEIKRININTAEYKELISHPYIDKDNTIKILNYRKFAKEINSFEDLLKQKAISKEFYDKLLPYITTE